MVCCRWNVVVVTLLASALASADGVVEVMRAPSLIERTVDVIDPVTGASAGSTVGNLRVAPGDVLVVRLRADAIGDSIVHGLQSYMTAYVPLGTSVVGARITDASGRSVAPRYPGSAVDGCTGGESCNTFSNLPCATGTCSFSTGSIAQVYADTGIFATDDPRLACQPSPPISLDNGITMSPEPARISPDSASIFGDLSGPYFAHNSWDYTQVRAYGTSAATANTGGDGNTPYRYGSPVAGPNTYYGYEATLVASAVQFNNVTGPWNRIRYPGSTTGFGVQDIGASSNITRTVVETTAGDDPTPMTPMSAVAVRVALGEARVGEAPRFVELALRVDTVPIADMICAEVFTGDVSSRTTNSGGRDNAWPFYLASASCTPLRLRVELAVDQDLAVPSDTLTYRISADNLTVDTAETGVVVDLRFDPINQSYLSATPAPATIATCADDATKQCLTWNIGTLASSATLEIEAQLSGNPSSAYQYVVESHYRSDQLGATHVVRRVHTPLTFAVPALTLATAFDPTTMAASAGTAAAMTGVVSNAGTTTWSQESLTLVLPTGWAVNGGVTLGGVSLSCVSGCGTSRPSYNAAFAYTAGQARTLTFAVNVPVATGSGLYRVDLQTVGSQSGVGGTFETYLPRAALIPVGALRTVEPVVTCPIRSGASAISGTAEADAAVDVRFDLRVRATATTSAGGAWASGSFSAFGSLYPGLEITAVATASGKLASEPSAPCVVTVLRPDGRPCSNGGQCASNQCVDGVCCDTGCTGQCEACDVAGSIGTCSPVTGAPHGTRTLCNGSGTCGGACDGIDAAACTYPDATTSCRDASCAADVATLAAGCDGQGACPAVQVQACVPYVCGATACAGTCSLDSHCASGNWCSGGVCIATLTAGTSCGGDNQCTSGNCVDGVCCNSACEGQCEACDVAGSVGACVAAIGTPRGNRAACAGTGACQGTCDGVVATTCSWPGIETACGAAMCTGADTLVGASACDGSGACIAPAAEACPHGCVDAACTPDPDPPPGTGPEDDDGGCQTTDGAATLLWLAAFAPILRRRRRCRIS